MGLPYVAYGRVTLLAISESLCIRHGWSTRTMVDMIYERPLL